MAALMIALLRDAWLNQGFAQCRSDTNVAGVRLGRVVGGVREVRVEIPSTLPERVQTAVARAMDAWNGKTGTTGVRFTTTGPFDITIRDGGQVNKCGDYRPTADSRHFLDLSGYLISALTPQGLAVTEQQADSRIDKARYPIAHELGHTMGLDESGIGDSVMKVEDYVQCNGATLDGFPERVPSDGDATRAHDCIRDLVNKDIVFASDGSQDYKETVYQCECDCWIQYEVIVGYRYSTQYDGYETDELYRFELSSGCGPPPDI